MSIASKFRRAVAGAALAGALAGPMMLTQAATANALPISNLQSECRGAGGSWYVEYTSGVLTGYQCWYRDNHGNQYVDFYDRRGNYYATG
ncbi:MAG: hypothetical protein LLG14_07670 [Nocardiaceae bacterium]|nr:hypothetical protein [Nocardiaceae bacterium]